MTFSFGLLVQAFGPQLKIHNNAYVIPPALLASGKNVVHPDELVRNARLTAWIAGLLTLGSAIGLGVYYRRALFGPRVS
jgi:hypothetical protein